MACVQQRSHMALSMSELIEECTSPAGQYRQSKVVGRVAYMHLAPVFRPAAGASPYSSSPPPPPFKLATCCATAPLPFFPMTYVKVANGQLENHTKKKFLEQLFKECSETHAASTGIIPTSRNQYVGQ